MFSYQNGKGSSAKIPNVNQTQSMPKYSGVTKEKSQFSILKANEIFLDAWSQIPDQSLPVSQLTSQHFANKTWYRENSVPTTGPACLAPASSIPKQSYSKQKKSKSPHLSLQEEKTKADSSKIEIDEETLAKPAVHPKIPEYSNTIHFPNDGFVSRQERAKCTLEKIMRKRIFESERHKNVGISSTISENLWDCKKNFIMANIQPISFRGQRPRNNKPARMNFQERLLLGKTRVKLNLPKTMTCLANFEEHQPSCVTYKDLKILPLPSTKQSCAMADSHFAQRILGPGRFMVKNHWKPGLSHMKIT